MRRLSPFQRGVLTGAALVGVLCAGAIGTTVAAAVTLAFADEPNEQD